MQTQETQDNSLGHGGHDQHKHLVVVIVDRKEKKVFAGTYIVSDFKEKVGVAADRELNAVKGGELHPLSDNAEIKIHGGEKFVSAVRGGGSS